MARHGHDSVPVRWRLPATNRIGFAACVALVAGMHCVLLASPASVQLPSTSGLVGSQPLLVRLVALAPTESAVGSSEATLVRTPTQRMSLETPALQRPLSERAPAPPPLRDVPAGYPGDVAQDDAGTTRHPISLDDMYLPRALLSVAPAATSPIIVDYPRFDGEAEFYRGEFDLFIDTDGKVNRVALVTTDLPGILAIAVRDAFMSASFTPGERDGLPVPARIRIEVTFDSRGFDKS